MPIFYICNTGRTKPKSLSLPMPSPVALRCPSDSQMLRLNSLLPVVLGLRGRSVEVKEAELAKYGLEVVERRVPRLCEVGSYYWYPRLRLFRLVVCSPHIDRRKPCFPYARVVEIRD